MRAFARVLLTTVSLSSLLSLSAMAQGGPPFRADDPETPESRHFEVNLGFTGDRNPAGGVYQTPILDLNYGLGGRMQIKYVLPIAIAETRMLPAYGPYPAQDRHVLGGVGESLLGVKLRFYQHRPGDRWIGAGSGAEAEQAEVPKAEEAEERGTNFAISTFPQLTLNNPTHSVGRGVVPPGPDLLLPLEVSAQLGPVWIDAEAGYHFANRHVPQSWIRGLVVGHEFSRYSELGVELYSMQEANLVDGATKKRETTLGLGGRQALNRRRTVNLMAMGGRSFQGVLQGSIQPSWFAYVGVRLVFGMPVAGTGERLALQVGQKQPGEDR